MLLWELGWVAMPRVVDDVKVTEEVSLQFSLELDRVATLCPEVLLEETVYVLT
jgi:hypothetical protein